eukprot:scaffold42948_cov51-Phaeocystis_antarctica.AAC.2
MAPGKLLDLLQGFGQRRRLCRLGRLLGRVRMICLSDLFSQRDVRGVWTAAGPMEKQAQEVQVVAAVAAAAAAAAAAMAAAVCVPCPGQDCLSE